jgi:hypothetical protein
MPKIRAKSVTNKIFCIVVACLKMCDRVTETSVLIVKQNVMPVQTDCLN